MIRDGVWRCDFCLNVATERVTRGDDLPYEVCAICNTIEMERVCNECETGELVPTRPALSNGVMRALCMAHSQARFTRLLHYGEDGANFLADLYRDSIREYAVKVRRVRAPAKPKAAFLLNYDR